VRIGERGGQVRARFQDNGKGFELSVLPQRLEEGHYGLPTMRERVELGGGRFSLRSEPGKGTVIDTLLPVGEADEDERETPEGPGSIHVDSSSRDRSRVGAMA
jgi:nitrate/nitrite-specific signal transduction histidine kinase